MIKRWETKYFEKTSNESHINIFRSLEIENYLKQLLKKKGYTLHSYRLNFSNTVLQIFVSAYKRSELNNKKVTFKTRKTELLHRIKSRNILKTIHNFVGNKYHISLRVLNVNNHHTAMSKLSFNSSKLKISEVRQLLPVLALQQDSAKLFGTFIAEYLKTTKRHNFFFRSLIKSFNFILKQQNNKIKGIKISIKGRLNNAARSRTRYIKVGSIPLITNSRNMDYSESTAFTPNGTIGIKIWVCHKNLLSLCQTEKTKQVAPNIFLKNF